MHLCRPIGAAAALSVALIASPVAFAQPDRQPDGSAISLSFNPADFATLDAQPGGELADVPVENASGALIGTVKTVALASDGSAARVQVGLFSGGTVWIGADALRYNRNARILLTNLKHIESSVGRQSF